VISIFGLKFGNYLKNVFSACLNYCIDDSTSPWVIHFSQRRRSSPRTGQTISKGKPTINNLNGAFLHCALYNSLSFSTKRNYPSNLNQKSQSNASNNKIVGYDRLWYTNTSSAKMIQNPVGTRNTSSFIIHHSSPSSLCC